MSDRTRIEWADATWNPVVGCTRVSEGCRNCYAERFAARFPERFGGTSRMTPAGPRWTGQVVLRPEVLEQPLRWRKPRRIFVCSMSDLFHPGVPDEFIDRVFAVMALAERHTFLVLTKRPERMLAYLTNLRRRAANTPALPIRSVPYEDGRICEFLRNALGPGTPAIDRKWPLSNVWLGISVENQKAAYERIPYLLQAPAAVRFLSCEPLLGPLDLRNPYYGLFPEQWSNAAAIDCHLAMGGSEPDDPPPDYPPYETPKIKWVIVGGESGPGARPMHPDWVRSIRDQCLEAGVPLFVKQMGSVWAKEHGADARGADWDYWPVDLRVREWPAAAR
ncbi:MAG: phage Gp37/Gp68 family protein [Bacillota bacterium]|nr:MAG: hypothetical protein DIU70_14135 [Bacillota bacterium]